MKFKIVSSSDANSESASTATQRCLRRRDLKKTLSSSTKALSVTFWRIDTYIFQIKVRNQVLMVFNKKFSFISFSSVTWPRKRTSPWITSLTPLGPSRTLSIRARKSFSKEWPPNIFNSFFNPQLSKLPSKNSCWRCVKRIISAPLITNWKLSIWTSKSRSLT